ncbi:unnamed protein product [Gongylonema pulchrum]|uniref:C2H2-type domain-containing protein n=1 Tax=Gongylonema pulchrum TaxID=637853 RepID=A0A183D9F1_9BILA|nr:unnamed protein product [Gongylonema pulchrum]
MAPLPVLQCPSCAETYINPTDLMFHMAAHRQQMLQYQQMASSASGIASSSGGNPTRTIASNSNSRITRPGNSARSPQATCNLAFILSSIQNKDGLTDLIIRVPS